PPRWSGSEDHRVDGAQRLVRRYREAGRGPQRRHHDLLPAGLLDLFDDAGVFPRVDEGAIDRLLLGKDILKLLDQVAAAVLDDRREKCRYAKDLRGLGKAHDVIDDGLRIVAAESRELERLMV